MAVNENKLDKFLVELGPMQGGPESPLLLNIFINYHFSIPLNKCIEQKVEFVILKYSKL